MEHSGKQNPKIEFKSPHEQRHLHNQRLTKVCYEPHLSPSAIWAEVEPRLHIDFEPAIGVDVLPDQRGKSAEIRRRQSPGAVRSSEHLRIISAARPRRSRSSAGVQLRARPRQRTSGRSRCDARC
jgi:hypothetical protein